MYMWDLLRDYKHYYFAVFPDIYLAVAFINANDQVSNMIQITTWSLHHSCRFSTSFLNVIIASPYFTTSHLFSIVVQDIYGYSSLTRRWLSVSMKDPLERVLALRPKKDLRLLTLSLLRPIQQPRKYRMAATPRAKAAAQVKPNAHLPILESWLAAEKSFCILTNVTLFLISDGHGDDCWRHSTYVIRIAPSP
jgi:hypothetical protein